MYWPFSFQLDELLKAKPLPANVLNSICMEIFRYQAKNVAVYAEWLAACNINPKKINYYTEIPFLPIRFYKSHQVYGAESPPEAIFKSSGTSGTQTAKHYVASLEIYRKSVLRHFTNAFGSIKKYQILALLPHYLEHGDASIVKMASILMDKAGDNKNKQFYLEDFDALYQVLVDNTKNQRPTVLLGVSYGLIDFLKFTFQKNIRLPDLSKTIIIETGGMKGRKKEITRQELHQKLKEGFPKAVVASEYGMTELLSQAYLSTNKYFQETSSLNVFIRDITDPYKYLQNNRLGALNIIDLCNVFSASFVATDDIGRKNGDKFTVEGRLEASDIRGCNLLAQ